METASASPAGPGGDRLSDLPDCLLHSVLSRLGSRQVVQASLLSRRWRHLWRGVPCVDIDQREFPVDEPEPGQCAPHEAWDDLCRREFKQWLKFEDFADAVLPLHAASSPSPLGAFRLHVADVRLRVVMDRWIRRGLARRPAALHVSNDGGYSKVLSFSFPSDSGAGAFTSRLRRLHLSGLSLRREFTKELTDHCPVLEDVAIVGGKYKFSRIASRSLKSLAMEGCFHRGYPAGTLVLATPRLASLKLVKVQLPVTSEDEMPSIAVASVADDQAGKLGLLKSLRSARVLELRRFTTTALLDGEPEEFREFHNLRTLILIECDIGHRCQVLRHVLQNVPNLERLALHDCEFSGSSKGEGRGARSTKAVYECKNLKSIEIKYEHIEGGVLYKLIDLLTDISKSVVGRNTGAVEWSRFRKKSVRSDVEWLRRVVSIRPIAAAPAAVAAEPDTGVAVLSDKELEPGARGRRAEAQRTQEACGGTTPSIEAARAPKLAKRQAAQK